jgi:hypothetical protein
MHEISSCVSGGLSDSYSDVRMIACSRPTCRHGTSYAPRCTRTRITRADLQDRQELGVVDLGALRNAPTDGLTLRRPTSLAANVLALDDTSMRVPQHHPLK